ncbi:MAG: hypothetical protein Alpg2KO_17350 [Alphaproteobacteria bacterium]
MRRVERGASLLSYGLVVGLIAVVALAAVTSSGSSVDRLFTDVSDTMGEVSGDGDAEQGEAQAQPSASQAIPSSFASCQAVLNFDPSAVTGSYTIDPDGPGAGIDAFLGYCDMDTDGGGWMLMALNDQTTTFTNFNKTWAEYKAGFGSIGSGGLGWIGNDRLHAMTSGGVDLQVRYTGPVGVNDYTNFSVGDEASNYVLSVSDTPTSNDGGLFASYHSGRAFSTFDDDNDLWSSNCASVFQTGWWFHSCYYMTIAGNDGGQTYWRGTGGSQQFVTTLTMWIR